MIPRWLAVVAVVWLALTGCQSGPVCGGSVARLVNLRLTLEHVVANIGIRRAGVNNTVIVVKG